MSTPPVRAVAVRSAAHARAMYRGRDESWNLLTSTWRKHVRDSLPGSVERLRHDVGDDRFWLDLHEPEVHAVLDEPRLQRAIGVIYRPRTERISHDLRARTAQQFDVLVHIDVTSALSPLDPSDAWNEGEALPRTSPWAV